MYIDFLKKDLIRQLKGIKSHFDNMDEVADEMRATKQRLAGLEQDARQPRLAREADVLSYTKTREGTEGATAVIQAKHGESCSTEQGRSRPDVSDHFGDDSIGFPALPWSWDDALVGNGAAAPKSCLLPLELRPPTAAGGVHPAGKASITTRITYYQPRPWFCPTEEMNSERTSFPYASYYSSFWWINNQLAAPFWRLVTQTNQGKLW